MPTPVSRTVTVARPRPASGSSADSPRWTATPTVTRPLLLGCALYYGVLTFNLAVTFWIDEPVIGTTGLFMYLPITAFLLLKLAGRMPAPAS